MPNIAIAKKILFSLMEFPKDYTQENFEQLCFQFGIELDEVTSEAKSQIKEFGAAQKGASTEEIYKIDVPANRYDLVCTEGIVQALRVFTGKSQLPQYVVDTPANPLTFSVSKNLDGYRPILVCAVLRGITFTQERYESFIDLQEKLHFNICRRRSLASVGTHDLDKIEGPFNYEAVAPDQIAFAPLGHDKPVSGVDMSAHMAVHRPTIVKYMPLLRSDSYPLIRDSKGRVLSLPPIINSEHSKISLATRNLLIEVTATDATKASIVLNVIACLFSQYCDKPFHVEATRVINSNGEAQMWPDLASRDVKASAKWVNSCIGVGLSSEQMANLLTRMSLRCRVSATDNDELIANVPALRSDVLHACDIMEDVAIAYGYDNITRTVPQFASIGSMQPLNKLTDIVRNELAQAGYLEILSLSLCSRAENYEFLRRRDDGNAVTLMNPQTIEFEICRTSLLPGMFKTVHANKSAPKPLKLFEVSDVVLRTNDTDVGAYNQLKTIEDGFFDDQQSFYLLLLHGVLTGFELLHGLLDRLMEVLDVLTVDAKNERIKAFEQAKKEGRRAMPVNQATYQLKLNDDAKHLFDKHAAAIYVTPHESTTSRCIGHIGMVHPEVVAHFEIGYPCSVFEIELEPFL